MHKRLNITLPESTIIILEDAAEKGNRSTFIDTAIKQYVKQTKQESLRTQIIEGAKANAELNLNIAGEWFPLEEEAWERTNK